MSEHRMIQLRPLSRDSDLPFAKPRTRSGTGSIAQEPQMMSLEEVKRQVGILYVPAYVPDGFELEGAMAQGRIVLLDYKGTEHRHGDAVRINQFSVAGRPMVKDGFYREIQVGGQPGYSIDGKWAVREDAVGNCEISWETGHHQEVMFERGELWWMVRMVHVMRTAASSEAELIEIAASMRAW